MKKTKWLPVIGDLAIFRGDKRLYTLVEVFYTPYGYTKFLAYSGEKISLLSTLNCDLFEHFKDREYDTNNKSKGETMTTTTQRIRELNLPKETKVNLVYSEGTDVFVHNETEIETALENTDVVNEYVSMILSPNMNLTTNWGEDPVCHLREQGLLEDYDRNGWFDEYLLETIYDNFYDAEVIDYSTEKYDHKRGFTTLTAELYTTVGDLANIDADFPGWKVTIETKAGDLTLN